MEETSSSSLYLNTTESDMSLLDLNSSVFIDGKESPEQIKNKCRELVSFPNESKYRDYMDQILRKSNHQFIIKHKDDPFFCEKLRDLNEYVESLKFVKKIKIKDFLKIKEHAISKGGFLTSENRKILYKKIYMLNHSNSYRMLYIDYKAMINKNWDFHEIDIFSEKRIYDNLATSCDDKTINVDYSRSRILTSTKNEAERDLAVLITLDLNKFLKLIFCLNNNIYNYYQGYHDLALFFMLLYHKCPNYAVAVFQRFSEFNLKELLNIKYNQRKIIDGRYNMMEMNDTLKILAFIIDFMDPKVKNFFEEIERADYLKTCKNKNIIKENSDKFFICDFAFEWIITLFSRYFQDYNKIYRILDYLMVSHSLAIYFLCAEIIIDSFYKIKNKDIIKDKAGQFDYFMKRFNFEEIDFDYYIQQCEKNLKKYIGNYKFQQMYRKLKLSKFNPIISEQPFVEKWVMNNNKQEYKSSFWNYLVGQWGLIKSLFINDDETDKNSQNNNKKHK